MQQPLVLLEELLVLVNAVIDSIFVKVSFSKFLGSILVNLPIVELEYVLMSILKFCFHLEINNFRKLHSYGSFARLLADNLVNKVHGLCRQLDQRQCFPLVDVRIKHQSLR